MRVLGALLEGSGKYFAVCILLGLLLTVVEMIAPQVIRVTVDSVIDSKPMDLPAWALRWVTALGGAEYLRANMWFIALILALAGLAAALLRGGAAREYFARIGETASEKIYLSWEDSVKNARAQYRSVIERWQSGELPRRRVLPGAPEWTGDVAELINRARAGWDKAREALDRYL